MSICLLYLTMDTYDHLYWMEICSTAIALLLQMQERKTIRYDMIWYRYLCYLAPPTVSECNNTKRYKYKYHVRYWIQTKSSRQNNVMHWKKILTHSDPDISLKLHSAETSDETEKPFGLLDTVPSTWFWSCSGRENKLLCNITFNVKKKKKKSYSLSFVSSMALFFFMKLPPH